ncbi:ABC transporter permease [Geotalea uraniireducens]|uniref:Binding-protein-dependent transport systems inner membrane component n=1 Tax=Geotalea uraniireducens (strain Rf4) TaxID=351605 RepID=A5G8B5_GEOUR|nr:ABC transporter permease [Geotalea uraniireducens]ABQ28033.1 binding-protein-dependent transport systems inner membrane component [Geotalea uraniireducens Rf4]
MRFPEGLQLHKKALGLIVPVLLLIAWEIVTRKELFSSLLLIPPQIVAQTFKDLIASGELINHLLASFARVFAGFLIGSLAGILLGAALGLSKRIEEYIGPTFHTVRQVPLYAWFPMLVLWFGIGEKSKVLFIAVAPFYIMALYTLEGIRGVPREYLEVGKVFEYGRLGLLRKFVLPSALPSIATGLRISLSFAWMAVVGAEILAASVGIGYMMNWGRQIFQNDIVFVGIITVGILGFIMDYLAGLVEAYFLRWRSSYR